MSDYRLKLIQEISRRPGLWDLENEHYKMRSCFSDLWKEVAAEMGPNVTVDQCKRRWKNLRDAYRAETKRMHMRIERDFVKGRYDLNYDYNSKWAYFKHMKFLKCAKRPRRICYTDNLSSDNTDDIDEVEQFAELYNIDEGDSSWNSQIHSDKHLDEAEIKQPHHTSNFPNLNAINISRLQQSFGDTKIGVVDNLEPACYKCLKHCYDQTHFYGGDSDYNFLISLLPHVKNMSELQNLQFRAKITDVMLNIMSQSIVHNVTPTLTSQN